MLAAPSALGGGVVGTAAFGSGATVVALVILAGHVGGSLRVADALVALPPGVVLSKVDRELREDLDAINMCAPGDGKCVKVNLCVGFLELW